MPYVTSVERIGIKKGIEQGMQTSLQRLLTKLFGELPDWARDTIAQADIPQLENWIDAALDAQSLEDLCAIRHRLLAKAASLPWKVGWGTMAT